MKIFEALEKAKNQKTTISSEKCVAVYQSPYSILHWLFSDDVEDKNKLKNFSDFLHAEDWKLDKEKEKK